MPLYEYECEGRHRFESIRSADSRYNINCPSCKRSVHIRPSLSSFRMAQPFTIVDGDGTVLHNAQTTDTVPFTSPSTGKEFKTFRRK